MMNGNLMDADALRTASGFSGRPQTAAAARCAFVMNLLKARADRAGGNNPHVIGV